MQVAFAYIRRSSYKQQDNHSVDIQKSRIQEFASRMQLSVPDELIFIEDATSAYTKEARKRKKLMALLNRMKETGINYVIFTEESRMDRTGFTFVRDFYRPLLNHFGEVNVYTTDSTEVWSPDEVKTKISFVMHRQESEFKSIKATDALKSYLDKSEGARPGAKVPYGYNQIKHQLVPNEKAEIVSFIYYLQTWGVSMKKIAIILTDAEIPAPKGGDWNVSTIETILKNPVYTGNLIWNTPNREGENDYSFTDSHPAIIPRELIDLVKLNQQLQKQFGRLDTPFLLLNKLQCQECGHQLQPKNHSTKRNNKTYHYRYYICSTCSYKLKADDIHELAIDQIKNQIERILSSDDLKEKVLSCSTETLRHIKSEIIFLDEQLENLKQKSKQAEEHKDKIFLDRVSSRMNEMSETRTLYQAKQELAGSLINAIQNGDFFKRFELISNHSLHDHELRLLILYFVEKVSVSQTTEATVVPNWDMLKSVFSQDDG